MPLHKATHALYKPLLPTLLHRYSSSAPAAAGQVCQHYKLAAAAAAAAAVAVAWHRPATMLMPALQLLQVSHTHTVRCPSTPALLAAPALLTAPAQHRPASTPKQLMLAG